MLDRKKFLVLVILSVLPREALPVAHYFNQGDITEKGQVTLYPATLGWLKEGLSFSVSASMLEKKNYDITIPSFESDSKPISIKPAVIASGLGKSWGGWSMLIENHNTDYRTASLKAEGATEIKEVNNFNKNEINLQLGSGLRLSSNWSLGWNLNLSQTETDTITIRWNKNLTEKILSIEQAQSKVVNLAIGMGFIYDNPQFTFAYHLTAPSLEIDNQGKNQTQSLSSFDGNLVDAITAYKASSALKNWSSESGVRFGKEGFVYIFSDSYHFSGSHKVKLGFEYSASWGHISSGVSRYEFNELVIEKFLVGFAKTRNDFNWAVGPFYESELRKGDDGYGARNMGVLYVSEIRY